MIPEALCVSAFHLKALYTSGFEFGELNQFASHFAKRIPKLTTCEWLKSKELLFFI